MVNDQSYLNIQELPNEGKSAKVKKESRKELIEMAAEQFASLLWGQYCLEKKIKRGKDIILKGSNNL